MHPNDLCVRAVNHPNEHSIWVTKDQITICYKVGIVKMLMWLFRFPPCPGAAGSNICVSGAHVAGPIVLAFMYVMFFWNNNYKLISRKSSGNYTLDHSSVTIAIGTNTMYSHLDGLYKIMQVHTNRYWDIQLNET